GEAFVGRPGSNARADDFPAPLRARMSGIFGGGGAGDTALARCRGSAHCCFHILVSDRVTVSAADIAPSDEFAVRTLAIRLVDAFGGRRVHSHKRNRTDKGLKKRF